MMRFATMLATCGAVLTVAAVELQAGPITVQDGSVSVLAQDSTTLTDGVALILDTQAMLMADTGNGSIAATTVSFSQQNGQAILDLVVDHQRTGVPFAAAITTVDSLVFTANATVPYAISGFYQFDVDLIGEIGASFSPVQYFAGLTDISDPLTLFENTQTSNQTPNGTFVLGGMSGEFNVATGSLTGTLIQGHQYLFSAQMNTQAVVEDGGALANGRLTLTIGEAAGSSTAVPEPSTLVMGCMGALAMCLRGVRRRRHTKPAGNRQFAA